MIKAAPLRPHTFPRGEGGGPRSRARESLHPEEHIQTSRASLELRTISLALSLSLARSIDRSIYLSRYINVCSCTMCAMHTVYTAHAAVLCCDVIWCDTICGLIDMQILSLL